VKTFLALLAMSALVLSSAWAEVAPDVKPDIRFTHYLSSSGPMSKEQVLQQQTQQSTSGSAARALQSNAAGTSTYTYLRCFYRTSSNPTQPTTTYVWGLDPSSGDYYRINGYWWASGVLSWENMFYSADTPATLQSVCQSTLAGQGISQPVAMVAAADNALSLNYTVWTNDSATQSGINKIVAFGDSLSDTQNIYNATQWTVPNSSSWFLGHFSNGYNWVEYLASDLQLPSYNWAIGDAGVTTSNVVIPGVIQQVQSFTQYMQNALNYQPQNTLFTMLIGSNDLIGGSTVAQVIAGETQALQNLIQAGAKNILLLNLPDISKAPLYTIKSGGPAIAAEVVDLNAQLNTLASSLRAQYGSSLHIQVFDTYTLFNTVLNNPGQYQVSNTTESCLNINTDSATNFLTAQTPRPECTNPDNFVFWDILHPTTHTHKVLADAVNSFLNANGGFLRTAQ